MIQPIKSRSTTLTTMFIFEKQESSKKIFQSSIQKHCLLFVNKESASYAPSVEALKKIALPFKGKALFVTVPPSEDRVYEYFEITEDQLPTLIVADMGAENGKYFLSSECLLYQYPH
jgi:Thioredoxin-like domain